MNDVDPSGLSFFDPSWLNKAAGATWNGITQGYDAVNGGLNAGYQWAVGEADSVADVDWNGIKSFATGLVGDPSYCGSNGSAYDAGNATWWAATIGGFLYGLASGVPGRTNDPDPAPGVNAAADSATVGAQRVQSVVDYYGDAVVAIEERFTVEGLGSGGADVVLSDGSYIEVGGPGKAISPSDFGRQLQILQAYAQSQGGTAKFLYAEGTPESVINQATKRLGADNVGPIP